MTRNLKAFGLALVAMLAFGGIAAQGASAATTHTFTSEVSNTVLTGKNESYTTGKSREKFTATAGLTVECDSTYEGTQAGAGSRDHVTVHPKYHNCTSSLGGTPTVHTNGCNYTFDSDTTTNTHPAGEHAPVTLECEGTHVIEITAPGCNFAFAASHNGTPVNQSLHGVTYTQLTSHGPGSKNALTVTATVRTIHYTTTPNSLCGLAGHPAATYTNGSLDGTVEVDGYTDSTPVSGSTTTGFVWGTHSKDTQVNIGITTP
jgi:hypothetical protein